MRRILAKGCASVLLLGMAAGLLWYAAVSNRIAAGDWAFAKTHKSARCFPEARYWWGNYHHYVKSDLAGAMEDYRNAMISEPFLIGPWFELIKTQMQLGSPEEARRVFSILAPIVAGTSYWKWKELLLAYDLKDGTNFANAFNFVLARSPARVGEAVDLGLDFWGDWKGLFAHVSAENLPALMRPLMEMQEDEQVLGLWNELKTKEITDKNLLSEVCDFTLNNGHIRQAREMWKAVTGVDRIGIHDGEFEMPPSNGGFGWRICEHPQVDVRPTSLECNGGQRSMHFRFLGTENVSYSHVFQVVPVEPGRRYSLTFARQSRNITTDQGVFLKVSGYRCDMPPVESRPLTGTNPWSIEKVEFQAPASCEAVTVQVTRTESLMLDNRISGDYWLDSVELHDGS